MAIDGNFEGFYFEVYDLWGSTPALTAPFVLAIVRIPFLQLPPLGEAGGVLVALVHPLLPGPLHLLHSPRSPPSPVVIASKM